MAKRKKYNPEHRTWRGRSYRKGGKNIRSLRDNPRLPQPGEQDEAFCQAIEVLKNED